MVVLCADEFNLNDSSLEKYFNDYPYPLSNFQKWAIYAITHGHHTLITAHTGSGKTLPAEFAIKYFRLLGTFDKCPHPNIKYDRLLISFFGKIQKHNIYIYI